MRISLSRQAIIIALLTSTTIIVSAAKAADYTISTPTTAQNGGVGTLNSGDTLSVTGTGAINITGAEFGISAFNGVTISNAGSIAIGSAGFFGISVLNANIIANSGTISTTGDAQSAIFALGSTPANGNNITNSGTITTLGTISAGIGAFNWNTVVNSGTINTKGTASNAVSLDSHNNFTNTGKINTFGDAANGALLTNNNTLINSGIISTTGIGSFGILVYGNNTITNSGIVNTTSNSSFGILAADDNTITNSGKVVSAQSSSFYLAAGNTLNLLAPSFIGGQISLGADTAVNITTGRSHSVLWDFSTYTNTPGMAFTGPVPWAWDAAAEKFATIDPTALSAAGDMLADITGLLSGVTRANSGVNDNNWWLNGYGNFSGYGAQTIYNDYRTLDGGIATGASFVLNDNFSLGAMAGYIASNLTVNSKWMTSQTITGNGVVGGIYGSARADNLFVDFAVYAGGQNNSSSRLVNDNLAPLGVDYANANYNSWFFSPEVRVGVDIPTDGNWTLTPSAAARYSAQQIAGYTETGSNANATIPQRQVQVFEGNLELAATRKLENGSLTLKGGAQYRQQFGGATQNIALLGQTLAIPLNNAGAFSGYAGLGAEFDLSDTSTLNLSAQGAIGQNNFKSLSAMVGFNTKLL